jgi:rSAM/selenodomain-associated transferase 1
VQPVIILFAKAPVPGRVKTRLQPPLTAEQAASLHFAFVNDLLAALSSSSEFQVELHTDIATDVWSRVGVTQRLQSGADLGLKMFHALDAALCRGHDSAMIVGTDAPTLPLHYLRELLRKDADVALGPSEDGGYYAIAARRIDPQMFAGVTWSEPTALQRTVAACERCGLKTATGSTWFDVDEAQDLERLMRTNDLPPETAAWKTANLIRIWQN